MPTRGPRKLALILATASLIALTGCDTAEDRAEGHYQSALELLEDGDVDRALVELRNVFDLDPKHHDARLLFASKLLETGDVRGAFAQFVLLSEMDPDNLEARVQLARLGIQGNNWEEARRHGEKAIEIAPDDPEVKLIQAVLDYQEAVQDEDESKRREVVAQIELVQATAEDEAVAARILVDSALRDGDYTAALNEVDGFLAENPDAEDFQVLRLRILAALGDRDGVREQLEALVRRFPDQQNYGQDLIRLYVQEGNIDAAEAYIRERISTADSEEAVVGEQVLLVNFLRQARSSEAALAEIDKLIESGTNKNLFRSLRAGLIFDGGDRDGAIAIMEEVVSAEQNIQQLLRFKVALARMLQAVGNEVAARQRVEEVLAEDSTNVDGIKMRAAWLIKEDKADQAIAELRAALQDAPDDPQIMALLAEGHLRNGSRDLAREMLALAVQKSNNSAQYTVPYARMLISEDNLTSAEDTLLATLRVRPDQVDPLALLGQIYLRQQDWPRAEQVESTLRRLETDQATQIADGLRVARLRGQDRDGEAFELLSELAETTEGVGAAEMEIVRGHLAKQEIAEAEAYTSDLVEKTGNSVAARMLQAVVYRASDRSNEAETIYRGILDESPTIENVWRSLVSLYLSRGDQAGARETLEQALEAIPEGPNLLWAFAGILESDGNIEGSIEVYEKLYARLPNSPIVANNLASLIATYREDDADLERAFTIARRLRGVEVPAFQDTYGWIAYRRGQYEEALESLEPAAAGLPNDPIVQYHYGMALSANGRTEDAIAKLQAAIDIAGPADTRPQFQRAKEEIDRLKALSGTEQSQN